MSVSFIDDMRERTRQAFDELHRGVSELVFTDFPDHANVGDSAIALGEFEYWHEKSISIRSIYSAPILPRKVYSSECPVVLHGGGSLGGLYPDLGEHRYRLAERLRQQTLLVQEPQSIYFTSDLERDTFRVRMAGRAQLRLGVRDQHSFDQVKEEIDNLVLSPDAVHLLGEISSPSPSRDFVVLARTDAESAESRVLQGSVDWLRDSFKLRVLRWGSWRSKQLPFIKPVFYRSNATWMDRAASRMARGVSVLSAGETIVTDRLHAMLIGLQMGRRVIAVDNNNHKLSAYASTWFSDLSLPLEFVESLEDGVSLAKQ